MKNLDVSNTEQHIIDVAKDVFVEKGFAETSMSDIAARAGLNRPTLHYYFRTKDRLYETVSAQIVSLIIPAIHGIIMQDIPWEKRIESLVNKYFEILWNVPLIAMFALKEVQRDAEHFLKTVEKNEVSKYLVELKNLLTDEMQKGNIKTVPLELIFYNFYGPLLIPFTSRPLTKLLFDETIEDNSEIKEQWKQQIINQLKAMLCV